MITVCLVLVVAAFIVIGVALALAELTLVYIAFGLAGLSIALLGVEVVRNRRNLVGRERDDRRDVQIPVAATRTDGLGKASVRTASIGATGSAVPVADSWENRTSAPAPAAEPVRAAAFREPAQWRLPQPPDPRDGEAGEEAPPASVAAQWAPFPREEPRGRADSAADDEVREPDEPGGPHDSHEIHEAREEPYRPHEVRDEEPHEAREPDATRAEPQEEPGPPPRRSRRRAPRRSGPRAPSATRSPRPRHGPRSTGAGASRSASPHRRRPGRPLPMHLPPPENPRARPPRSRSPSGP